ncbi:MAG: hypothetical protein PHX43_02430 [Alphaproteobacteria bacterium]|nr:hypothetical protein [Alphaproteobacteria bacterium]
MTAEELMALLEAVPCQREVNIAIRLVDGSAFQAPISGLAYKQAKKERLLILANNSLEPLSFNPWTSQYRLKP